MFNVESSALHLLKHGVVLPAHIYYYYLLLWFRRSSTFTKNAQSSKHEIKAVSIIIAVKGKVNYRIKHYTIRVTHVALTNNFNVIRCFNFVFVRRLYRPITMPVNFYLINFEFRTRKSNIRQRNRPEISRLYKTAIPNTLDSLGTSRIYDCDGLRTEVACNGSRRSRSKSSRKLCAMENLSRKTRCSVLTTGKDSVSFRIRISFSTSVQFRQFRQHARTADRLTDAMA